MAGSFSYAGSFGTRACVVVAALVGGFLCCVGRAAAAVEFCPAVLGNMSPIGASVGTPAASYSYELTALAPRSVHARLIADTSAGWFGWGVEGVALQRSTRYFRFPAAKLARYGTMSPQVTLSYPAVASDPLSVLFPYPVSIRHAWVVDAGGSACDVPDFLSADEAGPPPAYPDQSATPSPLPSPIAPAARAQPTAPPFAPTSCSTPFREATVTRPTMPELSTAVRDEGMPATSVVEVAVGKDGKLIDTWILGSSGMHAMDLSALRAARTSAYSGAVSYCRAVNGLYLFRVDFWPD